MITRDDWLKALADAGVDSGEHDPDALTIAEFTALMNLSTQAAARRLNALVAAGKAARTHKLSAAKDGRMVRHVAYRLTEGTA